MIEEEPGELAGAASGVEILARGRPDRGRRRDLDREIVPVYHARSVRWELCSLQLGSFSRHIPANGGLPAGAAYVQSPVVVGEGKTPRSLPELRRLICRPREVAAQ